ncbi:hypothetical protein KI387_010345, partial [Taxus chinensis]
TQTGSYNITSFTMNLPITLKVGTNEIALLSVTVGWQIGLKGEQQSLYSDAGTNAVQWDSGINPPNQTALMWYKTEFNAPKGNNAVALDLSTMSKGQAWVNGHHIGRYFPSFTAPTDGCSDSCDYRGTYSPANCATSCGKASQEWYHLPRSWLHPTNNVLVLLEEIGGDSSGISFRTRHVDTICGHVSQDSPTMNLIYEKSEGIKDYPHLDLQCSSGQHISSITFASFGTPQGSCGKFYRGSCHETMSSDIIETLCLDQEECSIPVSEDIFGKQCADPVKSLAVEAVCSY